MSDTHLTRWSRPRWATLLRPRSFTILGLLASALLLSNPRAALPSQTTQPVVDEIANGGFEIGRPEESPESWNNTAWRPGAEFIWDTSIAFKGEHSVRISAPISNDAAWIQTLQLEPDTNYLLSAWVRTEDVAHTGGADPGANLSLWNTFTRSSGLYGTKDWTYLSMAFNSGPTGEVTVAARIGFWSGDTTGTAWFDDLQVTRIDESDPHPRWKILVLIYDETDFEFVDGDGVAHHVVASMTDAELAAAIQRVENFIDIDIPALNDGNMIPRLEIRVPPSLRTLSPIGPHFWPAVEDTALDHDPEFDSILVVWDPRGTDLTTGLPMNLNGAGGLTPARGRSQTYTTRIAQGAVTYDHRNVFKHEWGHSILFFFEAMGASPLPAVTNHASAGQYVNWPSGDDYVWQDETLSNPIANSIYHNESGFTHDYYSGTTATPDEPSRRLGVTPAAWAVGGPITQPMRLILTTEEWLATLRVLIEEQVEWDELAIPDAEWLFLRLDAVEGLVRDERFISARKRLREVARKVDSLREKGGMLPVNAEALLFGFHEHLGQVGAKSKLETGHHQTQ